MGKKGVDDCSVLKANDVMGFRKYLANPKAISKDASMGAVRAKKLADKLGLDYI